MAWDYAELSKMAKANGGPEKLMDVLINSGKKEMFPWLGVAVANAKENSDIIVRKFSGNKKEYMDLLLLADEQEDMIDKYLERGEMFVLENDGVKGECVVTKEADGVYEIKNIAVLPDCQRNGYGKSMIDFVFSYYTDCQTMFVGTGDVSSALSFYQKCGFAESHRIKNFFTDNYDHQMFEDGKQLIDMVYLKRVQ